MAAAKNATWDRHVAALTSRVVSGAAILPVQPVKAAILAQKGVSMKAPEATALVNSVMEGKVHLDYVAFGGQSFLLTTVCENAFYGPCVSSTTISGIVLVKTRHLLIVAVFSQPTAMAQAIPYVHKYCDQELESAVVL